MTIAHSVTANPDGTHKFSWDVTKTAEEQQLIDEGKKVLHTISVAIIADPIILADGTIQGNNRPLYSWHHANTSNGAPQYDGSTFPIDINEWYPGWTSLLVRSYVCTFNDPENPISDQYSIVYATDLPILNGVSALAKISSPGGKPPKKK